MNQKIDFMWKIIYFFAAVDSLWEFQALYEGISKSFRTGRLERNLQMAQLSVTRCSCIAILWVSLVSFVAITLHVASQRVFIVIVVYFGMTQSGNFWIHLLNVKMLTIDQWVQWPLASLNFYFGWTIGVLGFDSRRVLGIFLFTTVSRTALEPTQPRIQWVPGALSLGVKRPGCEADHSPPSSAEVKNAWSYTSTPQYVFMAWCLVKHRDNFTFTFNFIWLWHVSVTHRLMFCVRLMPFRTM
jgi:hypothetical protein